MPNNSSSSSVQSAPDAGQNEGKEDSNIVRSLTCENESLTCENKSLKAQLAEKDALLRRRSVGGKTPASSLALIGTNSTEESADGTDATTEKRTSKERRIINFIGMSRGWHHLVGDSFDEGSVAKPSWSWYLPPLQRQLSGNDLALPRIDCGDVFFDIYYAGALTNLGDLFYTTIANASQQDLLRVFIYFFGSLGPLWLSWEEKTLYQSRFLAYDHFHNVISIFSYLPIGFAIFNIAPIQHYSNPGKGRVLGFTVAMLIEQMLSMGLTVELYFKCVGNRTLVKNHTWDDFRFRLGPIFVLYLAAVVIAAVQFAQVHRLGRGHGVHTAIERASWDVQDLPMTLTMAAYFARFILSGLRKFTMRNKEREVPSNIDYLIDRYGDIIMVFMGVCVVVLLSVDKVQSSQYYLIISCTMLTIVLIHVLRLKSEPSDSSKHALWRGGVYSEVYIFLVHLLSISLIGVSLGYQGLIESAFQDNSAENAVAFSARAPFLSITLVCLLCMNAIHFGVKKVFGYLFRVVDGKRKLYWPIVCINLARMGVILFCMSLFKWVDNPQEVAAYGLVIVFTMMVLHDLNSGVIDRKYHGTGVEDNGGGGERALAAEDEGAGGSPYPSIEILNA